MIKLKNYVRENLLEKPYPSVISIASGLHKKTNTDKLYCSQAPWLAYFKLKRWDLDSDGGYIVFPVDILNHYKGNKYVIK